MRCRRCPRNCKRRATVHQCHWGLEPWEGRTDALTREPGDLPRHITSPGGVSGAGRLSAVGYLRAAVRAHPLRPRH